MSLHYSAHRLWGIPLFALKPLNTTEDKKEITVMLFWLKQSTYCCQTRLHDRPTMPPDPDGVRDANTNILRGYLSELDGKQILSGDKIVFRTEDHEKYPLPSFAFLEMQWYLNRVTAWSSAAGVLRNESDLDPIFVERIGFSDDDEDGEED
ncbi:hypothetical protein BDW59DRAFT_161212 [Aspergillus cavernicola]|uniref:HNH nuclease domain-containing protein n=1 Tax=Aspergillus cavernicola TaxID=176166 RepID=A0ABR4IEA5_9EURO